MIHAGSVRISSNLEIAADLERGIDPTPAAPVDTSTITAMEIAGAYLEHQERRVEAGDIGPREFGDIKLACLMHFLDAVGENTLAKDLATASRWPDGSIRSPLDNFARYLDGRMKAHAFNRNVSKVRSMLKWAHKTAKLIAEPLNEHESLRKKRKRIARREQRERDASCGVPIFTPDECQRLIAAAAVPAVAGSPILAMILLAMNSGWGNSQIADLPLSVVRAGLVNNFIDWIRVKTEEIAQFPLWPITAWAIEQYLPRRPNPIDPSDADLCFVTRFGRRWVRETIKRDEDGTILGVNPNDEIAKRFNELQDQLGIRRPGRGFYAFRHTFSSSANDAMDRDATRRIMGHGFEGMDPHYLRSQFTTGAKLARLQRITGHVGCELLKTIDLAAAKTEP